MALAFLESQGISGVVQADDMGKEMTGVNMWTGVRLLVDKEDAQTANSYLQDMKHEPDATDKELKEYKKTLDKKSDLFALKIVFILALVGLTVFIYFQFKKSLVLF